MTKYEERRVIFTLDDSTYQKFLKKFPPAELDKKILFNISKQLLIDYINDKPAVDCNVNAHLKPAFVLKLISDLSLLLMMIEESKK